MSLYRVEGLVLRSRELGEADRLLTLFTRQEGKVRAVARGSRRPRSRLMAATQPLCYGRYLLLRGRELDTVSQAELAGHGLRPLREDLTRMTLASLTAELVDTLTEERAAAEALFEALLQTWQELACREPAALQAVVWWFELRLLDLLGYGPSVDRCAGCGQPVGPQRAPFSAREGGSLCWSCRSRDPLAPSLSARARAVLLGWRRVSVRGLARPALAPEEQAQLARALEAFVGLRLPGRLQSASVARALAVSEAHESWAARTEGGVSGDGGGAAAH